jgi:hypothetical protein
MSKAIIGTPPKDRAADKMERALNNSRYVAPRAESLVAQLQRIHGATWREELAEMRRESNPAYQSAKATVISRAHAEYYSTPRHLRPASPGALAETRINEWKRSKNCQ